MTIKEFNIKYKDYLESGFYGLSINNEKVIKYLDEGVFPELTKNKNFKYSQIKVKFGYSCFYCNISTSIIRQIENEIDKILKDEKS